MQLQVEVEDELGLGADGGADVERDVGVPRLGGRGMREVFDTHGVAVRAEPSEKVLGGRLVDGTSENDPGVAGVVAGIVLAMHVQRDRRDRCGRWHRRRRGRGHDDGREGRGWPHPWSRSLSRTTGGAKRKGS